MSVKISVIVPVYNAEAYIRTSMDCIMNQTLDDIEILAVDDCSTDSSREILSELSGKNPKIRLIEQEVNGGPGQARNAGIMAARGEYIAFVDCDDAILPDALESLLSIAKEHQADVVHTTGCLIPAADPMPDDLMTLSEWELVHFTQDSNPPDSVQVLTGDLNERFEDLLEHRYQGNVWGKLFRREFLNIHGIRFGSSRLSEDQIFCFSCLMLAKTYVIVPGEFYIYRIGGESASRGRKSPAYLTKILRSVLEASEDLSAAIDAIPWFEDRPEKKLRMLRHLCEGMESAYIRPVYTGIGTECLREDEGMRALFTEFFGSRSAYVEELFYGLHDRYEEIPDVLGDMNSVQFWRKRQRLPLSQSQLGVFLASQHEKAGESYNLPALFTLDPQVDTDKLARAAEAVIAAHPGILARPVMGEDGRILLEDHSDEAFSVRIEEALSEREVLERVMPWNGDGRRGVLPFDLLKDRLFRIRMFETPQGAYLYTDFHHLIFDGFSSQLFLSQVGEAYRGQAPEEETWSLMDNAREEAVLRSGEAYKADLDWYKENFYMEEFSRMPGLTGSGTEAADFRKIVCPIMVNKEEVDRFCGDNSISKSAFFETAFGYVLSEYNHAEEAGFVTVFHGRDGDRDRNTFAMMVRTLPVRIAYRKGEEIRSVLKQVHEQDRECRRRRSVSLVDLNKALGWTGEIGFVYQGALTDIELVLDEQKQSVRDLRGHEPGLMFNMEILKTGEGYEAHLSYPSNLLTEEFVRRFIRQVDQVAGELCRREYVDEIELLSDEERADVIRASYGGTLDYDISQTVTNRILAQAAATPDNVALSDGTQKLTYREMVCAADVISLALRSAGVKEDDFVAVMLPRSMYFPAAVLGIHKAGAAYLPLDEDYPASRLSYMLEDSGARVMLTTRDLLEKKRGGTEGVLSPEVCVFLEDLDLSGEAERAFGDMDVPDLSRPEGYAYMIYTSGSTGKPKGVMLHHAGLMNQVMGLDEVFGLTHKDRAACHLSFSFDAHVKDLYPILTLGGSLYIMPSEIRKDMSAIADFLKKHRITGVGFTTSLGRMLLAQHPELTGRFFLGGEALSGVTAGNADIYNVYGPTECTNDNTWYRLEKGKYYGEVPIGSMIPNMWGFVTDRFGHLLPEGVPGELCLAGIQVGCGYWNLPEKTAEVFSECPFVENDAKGRRVRMYRTGDLVYRNESGDLVSCGRMDGQVKLHGYRIELGEIEGAASRIPGIRECAAMVVKTGNRKYLALYYSLDPQKAPEEKLIRNTLQESGLASYMVPELYKYMEEFPRTPSGKIDRKNLPDLQFSESEDDLLAPRTISEQHLFNAVKKVLGRSDFGITTDLQALGLTSLDAIAVSAEAQKQEVLVKAMDLLQCRTIENVLKHGKKLCSWYKEEPAPGQRVLVVPYGINSVTRFGPLLDALAESFCIITVENILDHARFIFGKENVDDVVNFYVSVLDYTLPEDMEVYGFFGHSFGGELAYRMGARWAQVRHARPKIFLLDTIIDGSLKKKEFNRDWEKMREVMKKSDPEKLREVEADMELVSVIEPMKEGVPYPAYDGSRIVLFASCPDEKLAAMGRSHGISMEAVSPKNSPNIHEWKKLVPGLTVVPVNEAHDFLQYEKYAELYLRYM